MKWFSFALVAGLGLGLTAPLSAYEVGAVQHQSWGLSFSLSWAGEFGRQSGLTVPAAGLPLNASFRITGSDGEPVVGLSPLGWIQPAGPNTQSAWSCSERARALM